MSDKRIDAVLWEAIEEKDPALLREALEAGAYMETTLCSIHFQVS